MASSVGLEWYKTGTVNITQGSTTVMGVNTNWATAGIKKGDIFTVDDTRLYEIADVAGNTSITLNKPYQGAGGSAQSYGIIRNFAATMQAEIASQVAGLVNKYDTYIDTELQQIVGPKGDPGWAYKGAWASGRSYNAMDVVTQSGALHVALSAHTSASANAPGAANSLWMGLGVTMQEATENVAGVVRVASSVEIQNKWKRNSNDNKALTLGNTYAVTNPADFILYVDGTNGSDANDGTSSAPKKTIQAAINATNWFIGGSATIKIRPGTYELATYVSIDRVGGNGSLTITADNTDNMPIITNTSTALGGSILFYVKECSISQITISYIKFMGNKSNQPDYAIRAQSMGAAFYLFNSQFDGFVEACIYAYQNLPNILCWNSRFSNSKSAFLARGHSAATIWSSTIDSSVVYRATLSGGSYSEYNVTHSNQPVNDDKRCSAYLSNIPTDALKAANSPSANNPIATMRDVKNPASVTIYVDSTNGNDSNPGTSAAPFKTIQAAINSLPKNFANTVNVYLKPGTHTITQSVYISGFSGSYIYIAGTDQNNKPLITSNAAALGGNEIAMIETDNCNCRVIFQYVKFSYTGTRTGNNSAIRFRNTTTTSVHTCEFSGNLRFAIWARSSTSCGWFQNNIFSSLYCGYFVGDNSYVAGWNNTFNNCSFESIISGGTYCPSASILNNSGKPSVSSSYEFYAPGYPYAAIKAANSPSETNPFATMADVNSLLSRIQQLEAKK